MRLYLHIIRNTKNTYKEILFFRLFLLKVCSDDALVGITEESVILYLVTVSASESVLVQMGKGQYNIIYKLACIHAFKFLKSLKSRCEKQAIM